MLDAMENAGKTVDDDELREAMARWGVPSSRLYRAVSSSNWI